MKSYYIYIMASKSGTLYIGFTNNVKRRVFQHKHHLVPGFTDKHNVEHLLYFESFRDVTSAIAREKQLKTWSRTKKIQLIDSLNPEWNDLSEDWF